MHDSVKRLKVQLVGAALTVVVSAVALSATTYAWFVTNSRVHATTSTISAQANGMVLQIVEGDTPDHGSDTSTVASATGHEISPSSTNDAKNWYVPKGWQGVNVSTYQKVDTSISGEAPGKYTIQGNDYYAFTAANYTLYTVANTGIADVYLDASNGSPITIAQHGGTQKWFDKIKGSLRVGIVINGELRVVYAPTAPSTIDTGNDVIAVAGWSCVDSESLSKVVTPTYLHLSGADSLDQNGDNWGATKAGEGYIRPSGNAQKVASNVDYNGTNMKVVVWMEGTDSDCQNMSGLDVGEGSPTFDVTVSLVGIVADSK